MNPVLKDDRKTMLTALAERFIEQHGSKTKTKENTISLNDLKHVLTETCGSNPSGTLSVAAWESAVSAAGKMPSFLDKHQIAAFLENALKSS